MSEAGNCKHDEYVNGLITKVAAQARQMQEYERLLMERPYYSEHKSDRATTSNTNSLSEMAHKKRIQKEHMQQLDALQRQLDSKEFRLAECIKSRNEIQKEFDAKSRALNFLEKQYSELQQENQSLKAQITSTVRIASLSSTSTKGVAQRGSRVSPSSVHHQHIGRDEIQQLKKTLETSQQEADRCRAQEAQLKMKIKVLEDALELRSDEIGLSGSADLLAKLAHLRGEVSALKVELTEKRSRLSSAEDSKSDLAARHESLKNQLATVQQRLAQTQQETFRLQNGDIGELLRATEEERDRLRAFLENDLNKSTHLARQVERLESELRVANKKVAYTDQKLAEEKARNEENSDRRNQMDDALCSLEIQVRELTQSRDDLQREKDSLSQQLERRVLECEEVGKLQASAYMQVREREDEIRVRDETLAQLRGRVAEAEHQLPRLQEENSRLKQRCEFLEHELAVTKDSVADLEPRLSRMEPDYVRLRVERDEWHREKMDMLNELVLLRPLDRQLSELSKDLTDTYLPSQERDDRDSSGPSSPSRSRGSGGLTASQQHAAWIGLPSIRSLHPGLYERIRAVANDLHRKETQCQELQTAIANATREQERLSRENASYVLQVTQIQDSNQHAVSDLAARLRTAEEDAASSRAAQIALDQVRLMLRTYPGSVADLYPHKDGLQNSGSGLSKSAVFSLSGRPADMNELLHDLPDNQLPDLIGRIAQCNTSAVVALSERNAELRDIRAEHSAMEAAHHALTRERNELDNRLADSLERLAHAQAALCNIEADRDEQLSGAANLADGLNALLLSKQAETEALQRELKLRSASITSLSQREETIRVKLLGSVLEYCTRMGIQTPPDSVKVVDLLGYINDALGLSSGNIFRFKEATHSSAPATTSHQHHDFLSSSLAELHESLAAGRGGAAWMSPEKFTETYGGGGSSGRKRIKSPVQNMSSSRYGGERRHDNHSRSTVWRPQMQPPPPPPPPPRRSNTPDKSGRRGSSSRSPPTVKNTVRVSSTTRTEHPGNDIIREHDGNSESSPLRRSHSGAATTGGGALRESGSIPLHERLNRAKLAFAALRE